jgi:hypothetical protein
MRALAGTVEIEHRIGPRVFGGRAIDSVPDRSCHPGPERSGSKPAGTLVVEGNGAPDLDIVQRTHREPVGNARLGQLLAFHLRRLQ